MLIESIGLKNFKCFEEVNVDFAPITLLTGANSSGKSSLINAILGIMQTEYFPEVFALNGNFVKMGGIEEILWKGERRKTMGLNIKIDNSLIQSEWRKINNNDLPILQSVSLGDKTYSVKNEHNDYIEDFSDLFFDLINNGNRFNYIGSYRIPPDRTYYIKPTASKVKTDGEGYIDQIIDWEATDELKFIKLVSIIKDLGLFYSIESTRIKGGRFEINVKVNEKSPLASLTDVGFGISQFLPIIVADLQLDDNSCLITSQPEIHLHPKIQASLANYFCKQIHQTKKQYIVETHSEYLLNRIRLLLVKGELQPEDVKLYYMENDGYKTTTYDIELTPDGQIKNAPKGFFETYEMDVMDIALAAAEL